MFHEYNLRERRLCLWDYFHGMMKCRVIVFINEGSVLAVKWLLYRCVWYRKCKYAHLVVPCAWVVLALCCRRSTYNHLSSWLTDARNLTNPNTVSDLTGLLWRGTGVKVFVQHLCWLVYWNQFGLCRISAGCWVFWAFARPVLIITHKHAYPAHWAGIWYSKHPIHASTVCFF